MDAFQVYTRIRPLNGRELQAAGDKMAARQIEEGLISVGEADKETSFQVDRVFDEEVTNREIF